MLYLVPKKSGFVLLSTRGPGALTRHLAELGITRPRATLDQVNACSWAASLRGDNALRVIADATRRPSTVLLMTWTRAFAVLLDAAMNHARKKTGGLSRVARYVAPIARSAGPVPLFDVISKCLFNEPRPPGRGEQPK